MLGHDREVDAGGGERDCRQRKMCSRRPGSAGDAIVNWIRR
jgi:hypothetical protein